MRFAKTVTALALACSLALAIPTFAAPAAEEQAGRQEDLELLYQTIRDRHPGPFTNTPEQEFLARIAQIEARIDTEDSMSFGLDLQSLAALIGDSHTTTNLNSILSSGHMFPVSVKWMDGDWVLYQVDASHQGALGQQVTSVNGFSMDQVQEKMAPLISADNEIKLRRQLSPGVRPSGNHGLLRTAQARGGSDPHLGKRHVYHPLPSLHAGPVRLAGDQWPVPAAPGQRPH